MTPDELAARGARAEAATPGPWTYSNRSGQVYESEWIITSVMCYPNDTAARSGHPPKRISADANGAFIAAAREDVPALLAEVERLHGFAERLRTELENQWRSNHWEHCGDVDHVGDCYWPRPAVLDE